MRGLSDKSLVELFPDPFQLHELRIGAEDAIAKSLDTHKVQTLTRSEVKRRFDMCMDWCPVLRGDMGWGASRIVGSFGDILKAELSGGKYEPSKRQIWLQHDGA